MVLVDVHPAPEQALCDGPQALLLDEHHVRSGDNALRGHVIEI